MCVSRKRFMLETPFQVHYNRFLEGNETYIAEFAYWANVTHFLISNVKKVVKDMSNVEMWIYWKQ